MKRTPKKIASKPLFHGKSHYFRGTQIVDQAIAAKQEALIATGLRPTESDIILQALLASAYLFPPTISTNPEAQA